MPIFVAASRFTKSLLTYKRPSDLSIVNFYEFFRMVYFNPLPPSDAGRKQKKNILDDIFSIVTFEKKYHPSRNLKFHYIGIFQSLKLRVKIEKIHSISPKLNFTPKTLGCYQLKTLFFSSFWHAFA